MNVCMYVCCVYMYICMCMHICVFLYVHCGYVCAFVSYVCLVIFARMTGCVEDQSAHPRGFRQKIQRSLSLTYTISVPHFPRQ